MKFMKLFAASSLFASAALMCTAAQATPIINAGSGLVAPTGNINFQEFSGSLNHTQITTQYASVGISSFTNAWFTDQNFGMPYGNGTRYASNWNGGSCSSCAQPIEIMFSALQTGVAMNMGSNPSQNYVFSIYNGATLIESFSQSNRLLGGFYGFTNNAGFDKLVISFSGSNQFTTFDNLQFTNTGVTSVPAPGALMLLGLGLLGLCAFRRKKGA